MTTIAPEQDGLQTSLGNFLKTILPSDVVVIITQDNRVPEPRDNRFVVMTPLRAMRLRTNLESNFDVKFTGSIPGAVMTVTDIDFGTIVKDATVFGVNVAPNTVIGDQITGSPGGIGTYSVSPPQTLSSRTLASGATSMEQGAEVVVQLDFHTANNTAFGLSQIVSTVFRSPKAVEIFAAQDPQYGVAPLYADDPRQAPFINESQQVEWRWIVEAHMQVNQVTSLPQQFFDAVDLVLKDVDALFPP